VGTGLQVNVVIIGDKWTFASTIILIQVKRDITSCGRAQDFKDLATKAMAATAAPMSAAQKTITKLTTPPQQCQLPRTKHRVQSARANATMTGTATSKWKGKRMQDIICHHSHKPSDDDVGPRIDVGWQTPLKVSNRGGTCKIKY
jgi:hypothetical protein